MCLTKWQVAGVLIAFINFLFIAFFAGVNHHNRKQRRIAREKDRKAPKAIRMSQR